MSEDKKIPPYRIFTIFALAFLFGIFISSFINFEFGKSWLIFLIIIFSLLFASLINFVLKNRVLTVVSFSLATIIIAMNFYAYFSSRVAKISDFGQQEIAGTIINNPQSDYQKQRVEIAVSSITNVDVIGRKPRVLVDLPKYPIVEYGDIVSVSGQIEAADDKKIEASYRKYLKKKLVSGIIQRPERTEVVGEKTDIFFRGVKGLYMISSYFLNSLNNILPEPQASLAAGLILGVKRNIPDYLTDDLNKAGLTHIIALSGYNVTIIMVVLAQILQRYLGKKKTFWCGLGLILLFVIMTGAASSVVRAAIFSSLIIYGATIGRKADQTNVILLAAITMIIINPYILVNDVGFQLSFLAFCGLIYFSPLIKKFVESSKLRFWPEWIMLPLVETLAAQVVVFPLIIYVFGRFSLIAPVANLIVLGIIPTAMAVSFLAGLGGLIYFYLGEVFGLIAWPVLTYVIKATEISAALPFSSFEFGKNSVFLMLVLYSLVSLFLIFGFRKFKIVL